MVALSVHDKESNAILLGKKDCQGQSRFSPFSITKVSQATSRFNVIVLSQKYRTSYVKSKARHQDYILAEAFALVSLGECIDQPYLKKKETYFGMEEREGKETKRKAA